jgi:beta-mannosidase
LKDDQVIDSVTEVFGVRSVQMAPNPESPRNSEDWTMVINGSPVFVRGANWAPPDALPGRLRREDCESLIVLAKDAGINLLRVWGGGLREKRAFYDLCDEHGLMVWQDFPLACLLLGHLPLSTGFRRLLREEGGSIVRQLRNHPSLVLWCGGNEFSYRRNRRLVDSLHEVVSAEDGTRPFRKTSPGRGDAHNWLVWHGRAPIRDYRDDVSQFSSEFGLQSVPHASSLSQFLSTKDLFPPNDVWSHHSAQLEKLERYAGPTSSSTLEEWILATQRAQANGLQVAIEHFRRRKYRTSGTATWQFNEPWPAISWSLVDYYGQPKLAYERLKSLYNPILVSLVFPLRKHQKGDQLQAEVWCVNDLLTPFADCSIKVQLDGAEVFSRSVSLPPDSSQCVGSMELVLDGDPVELAVRLLQGERVVSSNSYDLAYYDPAKAGVLDVLYHRMAQWLRE